ncbi:MAG: hypothetical protein WCA22_18870 [Candidatus Binatus sp.]
MFSTLYHEQFPSDYGGQNPSKSFKSRLGDQLDEMAIFALVACAVFYIVAASCWFIL